MKHIYSPIVVLMIFVFFCPSCRTKEAAGDNDMDTIVLKLSPIAGEKYYYTIHNESSTSQEVNDSKIETANSIETGMLYEITKDSSGDFNFKTTYKVFKIKAKQNENEREIDASTAGGSLILSDRVFAAFQNAVIETIVTPGGEVKAINGMKELFGNMLRLAGDNQDAIDMVQGSLAQYADEEFFKNGMEQNFRIFPDKPVKAGDSWTINNELQSDLQMPYTASYTLKRIKDNLAYITVNADVNAENQLVKIGDRQVTASIKGTQEGEIKVDIATGMILNSEIKLSIKGSIQVMGMDVPLTMKTKISIERKKM